MQDTAQSLLAGFAPNFILVSIGCLLLLGAAFLLGIASRSSELWYDRLATWRIRRFAHYGVGDRVTLGANIQGTVTKLTPFSTVLIRPDQVQVILSNSLVLRHPIYLHPLNSPQAQQTEQRDGEMTETRAEAAITAPSTAEGVGETENGAQASAWVVAAPSALWESSLELPPTTEPDAGTALSARAQASNATLAQPVPFTTSGVPFTNEAVFANAQAEPPVQLYPTTPLAALPIAEPRLDAEAPEGADDLAKLYQLPVAPLPVQRIARLQQRPPLGKYTVKRFKRHQIHSIDQRLPGE